jgi:hypothetical protein
MKKSFIIRYSIVLMFVIQFFLDLGLLANLLIISVLKKSYMRVLAPGKIGEFQKR